MSEQSIETSAHPAADASIANEFAKSASETSSETAGTDDTGKAAPVAQDQPTSRRSLLHRMNGTDYKHEVPPEKVYVTAGRWDEQDPLSVDAEIDPTKHAKAGNTIAVWEYTRGKRIEVDAPISVKQ